ncbi:FadR/GntR family transcriptional regulator [Aliiruegeria sabulilitoris]|uniref:FadR/GntR family transcriptional regulator n=1 Tax=Aliiruegeria sabulilitoris TaxID=1510458 RepID=UPI000834ACDE|nr:GntR family transcriptional regulator [Aliiruegeria sabulilitoris]
MGDDQRKKTNKRLRHAIMNFTSSGGFAERALNSTMQVVEQLGLGIVAGKYPQGTLIPFDPDLEDMFGVSRTVIREAKRILVAKGLLESKAKVGTRVRPATDWSMFDVDALRWHASLRQSRRFQTSCSRSAWSSSRLRPRWSPGVPSSNNLPSSTPGSTPSRRPRHAGSSLPRISGFTPPSSA